MARNPLTQAEQHRFDTVAYGTRHASYDEISRVADPVLQGRDREYPEVARHIRLDIDRVSSRLKFLATISAIHLTPEMARRLAAQLLRLADQADLEEACH